MKIFLVWLATQCLLARILFGIVLHYWWSMWQVHTMDISYIGYFVFPVTLVCVAETIASAIVVYPLVEADIRRLR